MNDNKDVLLIIAFGALLLLAAAFVYQKGSSQPQAVANPQAVAAVRGANGPAGQTVSRAPNAEVQNMQMMNSAVDVAKRAAKLQQSSDQSVTRSVQGSQ